MNGSMSRALRPLFLVLTAIFVLAACSGGDDEATDVGLATLAASTDDATETASADAVDVGTEDTSTAEEERTIEDAQLDFAQCVRETGFPDFPDPAADAQGGRGFDPAQLQELGIDVQDEDFRAALDECRTEFDGVAGGRQDLDPEQQAELQDQALALFACVRENPGWEDLPDIEIGAGPGALRDLFTSGELDVEEFRTLSQECQTELGIEGGIGGAPGGGGRGAGQGGAGAGQGA